jgi:LAS superfamily LD-carboxypeptidase LdcB
MGFFYAPKYLYDMKKFIITESEKNDIRKMYGLIKEQADVISQYVSDPRLQNILREIETTLGEKFTKEHFEKEIGLSGQIKNEAGGLLPEVEKAFEKMKNEAGCPRIDIRGDVSYRTYEFQKNQFLQYAKKTPKIDSAMVQASIPGFSAHHTGRAIDYYEDGASNYDCLIKNAWPNGDFNTPNKWGFTLPYMSGNIRKKEPWHLYYVGTTQQQSQSNQTQQQTGTLSVESTVDGNEGYNDLFKQIRDKTTGISINKDSIDLDFIGKTFSVDYGNEKIEKMFLLMSRDVDGKTKEENFTNTFNSISSKYKLEPWGVEGNCKNCWKGKDGNPQAMKYQLFIAKPLK